MNKLAQQTTLMVDMKRQLSSISNYTGQLTTSDFMVLMYPITYPATIANSDLIYGTQYYLDIINICTNLEPPPNILYD